MAFKSLKELCEYLAKGCRVTLSDSIYYIMFDKEGNLFAYHKKDDKVAFEANYIICSYDKLEPYPFRITNEGRLCAVSCISQPKIEDFIPEIYLGIRKYPLRVIKKYTDDMFIDSDGIKWSYALPISGNIKDYL